MNIAEKRLPQDGRIKMRVRLEKGGRKEVDMRISSLPTIFGEKIVARILDREMLKIDLTQLGFEQESLDVFKRAIIRPWGIILVTGPTGSGKTNTLYSAISTLNAMEKNIMTAEDPVEFYIPGINQVNIREEINLNFATSFRAFLRQDPDIMLVGEMRDSETVDVAIKAALTGHLVFSTVHTNDAASHDSPSGQYGCRALSHRRFRDSRRGPTARPPRLQRMCGSSETSRPDARRHGIHFGRKPSP